MIAEAAYHLARKRGFLGEHSLDDWLAAEQHVRQAISPSSDSEATMNDTTRQNQPKPDAQSLETTEKPGDARSQGSLRQSTTHDRSTAQQQGASRFEKFASTQAAGDGIQGDTLKKDKTADEKIGANMADRK